MPIPQEILKLVERFDSQREAYQSGKYNEAQIRAEFIDPLFKALGWDIHNEQGYAEAYKDVIHEDAIKIGGATEAPDLCFRIGGARKFFVECKKPSVNIKDDVHPAYQLRRYAWSARLPLSILTDFHELAVYDCRAKPNKTDSSAIGRLMYFTSNQFTEKWDEFAAVFSREAVLKGSFDKFAESTKGKKGTSSVDDAFLEEIERWRDMLARNIALRNEKLSQRELNFAVQRIIDRIIFLRICEDRGIEPYGRLMTLRNGERAYPRLCEFFQRADERYNSGLFHFQREKDRPEAPDELTLSLNIDNTVLKDIVGNLYYPESPYEFSVLPADILGHVYERFLGKVIRLTAGHQAKVEDKPEVRKAGGVYYTPTYIVDYIVKNTVGNLLEGKTPKQAAKLKILDPACGSGSFLLGAYQYLLNWHRDYYVKAGPEKNRKVLYQASGDWRLMTDEKKRILLNNIYGVDIDSQAVEVTKLSLLLKVLEGESQETITKQFELFHQRALPDLGSNIKCGNSLIGPDFYKDRQGELFGEDEMFRINAFDWQAEYAEIFKAGGFNSVIGNPPYVLGRETFDEAEKRYFSNHYDAFGGKYDLYIYFTEKAVRLVRDGGRLGYILPNTLLVNENATKLRKLILDGTSIERIRIFASKVFEKAEVENIVLILQNNIPATTSEVRVETDDSIINITQNTFQHYPDYRFNIHADTKTDFLFSKIKSATLPLGELCEVCIGIQLGGSSGSDTKETFISCEKHDETFKKVLDGKNINRYMTSWMGNYVRYGKWLHRPRDQKYFLNPKIMIRQIGASPISTYDDKCFYTLNTIYNVITTSSYSLKFILGVLNSKLARWFWVRFNSDFKTIFPKIKKAQIEALPILRFDFSNKSDVENHNHVATLVERTLDLHKRVTVAKTDHERTLLERQIFATDREIDQLVYELYGLTASEIAIVEGVTKSA